MFRESCEAIGLQIITYCLLLFFLRGGRKLGGKTTPFVVGILILGGILTTKFSPLFHWSLHALIAGLCVGGVFATLGNLGNLRRARQFGFPRLRLPSTQELVLLGFVTPFAEELFYRASLQGNLQHLLPNHWAIVLSSFLFTYHHVAFFKGEVTVGRYTIPFPLIVNSLLPLGFSLSVGLLYSYSESLLAVYVAHAFVNLSVLLLSASLKANLRTRFAFSS